MKLDGHRRFAFEIGFVFALFSSLVYDTVLELCMCTFFIQWICKMSSDILRGDTFLIFLRQVSASRFTRHSTQL